jgi:hypothetical protein
MLRLALAIAVAIHGAFQLFGAAVAFELIGAERLYENLLVGGHLELASAGGTPIGVALIVTGLAFVAGAVALLARRGWALPLISVTIIASMLVTAVGERSISGTLVNLVLLVGVWQLWRSEPAWDYPR